MQIHMQRISIEYDFDNGGPVRETVLTLDFDTVRH